MVLEKSQTKKNNTKKVVPDETSLGLSIESEMENGTNNDNTESQNDNDDDEENFKDDRSDGVTTSYRRTFLKNNKRLVYLASFIIVLLTALILVVVIRKVDPSNNNTTIARAEEQEQRCMDTLGRHKSEPSAEGLFNCKIYEENSCCTHETTKTLVASSSVHVGPFNWEKCGGVSPQCEQFIKNEMCFYYCSPNTYPWAEKILPSTEVHPEDVGETYSKVPICSSYCDSFYEACKDEPICVTNWYTDWDVRTNSETGQAESFCKEDSTCDTFGQRFENSAAMCNGIFGDSYVSTPGTPGKDCLVMTFPDPSNNPNDAVSAWYSQ